MYGGDNKWNGYITTLYSSKFSASILFTIWLDCMPLNLYAVQGMNASSFSPSSSFWFFFAFANFNIVYLFCLSFICAINANMKISFISCFYTFIRLQCELNEPMIGNAEECKWNRSMWRVNSLKLSALLVKKEKQILGFYLSVRHVC